MAKTPKIELATHLPSDELRQRYRTSTDAKTARRWHVLWLASTGMPIHTIATFVGLHRNWVRTVIKRYNADGVLAVADRHQQHPGGRTPLLNAAQEQQLTTALQTRPADGGQWSGPKVAAWIKHMPNRSHIHAQLGWVYVRKLGYTPHVPRPQHPEAASLEEHVTWKQS